MTSAHSGSRFLIQIDRPGEKLDMAGVRALLQGTGIRLDDQYGPILINPKLGRYVVRGSGSAAARARAEEIPGVHFFTDTAQQAFRR